MKNIRKNEKIKKRGFQRKSKKKIILSKEVDYEKVKCAIEDLANATETDDDVWEVLGILIDDFADVAKAPNKVEFKKQKKDLLKTLKIVEKIIRNRISFDGIK